MSVEHSVGLVCFLTCFLGLVFFLLFFFIFKFSFYLSMEQFVAEEVGAEKTFLWFRLSST